MTQLVVGRASELAQIRSVLDDIPGGAGTLLFSGPAGIGKTTLWLAAIDEALARGYRVVSSRPVEVETHLPFSALIDLLDSLADAYLGGLPDPQRSAVEAALFRTTAERPPDPLGVALGVVNILRRAAADRPLVLAIDDVPWLDESSARVLAFATRRLETEAIGLIATRRTTDDARREPPRLFAGLPASRRVTMNLGPLTLTETNQLLRHNLALELNRSRLDQVHTTSGGNAFYALELGRAVLQQQGDDGPLLLPESLSDLVGARIEALPAEAAQVVLFAACLTNPSRSLLSAALGDRLVADGLSTAAAAGILVLAGDAVRFTHPLLAAAAYGRASDYERRDAHRRLAAVCEGLEDRAKHLAVATTLPDAEVAALLEASASGARARGAADAAAELMERSAALTPSDDQGAAGQRMVVAAQYHLVAGNVPRARRLLEGLLEPAEPGPFRRRVLSELAHVLLFQNDLLAAGRLLREALLTAEDDPRTRVAIERDLAGVAYLSWQDWDEAGRHIDAAMELAESLGDPVVLLETIGHFATWERVRGRGLPARLVERGRALKEWESQAMVIEHPELQFAYIRAGQGDVATAREIVVRKLDEAQSRGEWATVTFLLGSLGGLELERGNWDRAASLAVESRDLVSQTGQEMAAHDAIMVQVRLHALRGDLDLVTEAVAEVNRLGGFSHPSTEVETAILLGSIDLSRGDPAAALQRLEALAPFPGEGSPPTDRELTPQRVEALLGVGRFAEARSLLIPFLAAARAGDERLTLAESLRCEALLLAAEGDPTAAIGSIDEAVAILRDLDLPFRLGRAFLASGEVRRRARQKGAARREFAAAVVIFERLGAGLWAERARAEERRTIRANQTDVGMTDTQRQIADLVALGRSNREIAGSLFMSVHTVEAHLTRIYRTMGLESRTELARLVLDRPTPEPGSGTPRPSSR